MEFNPETLYHVYNRGNQQQFLFFNRENYLFFLKKLKKELLPHTDIISYCLMPNHFHFLLYPKIELKENGLNKAFGILLSSYTRAINIQNNRRGSLFQQHTKAKEIPTGNTKKNKHDDAYTCFNYIHQNPVKAGLVKKMEDWEFSSFKDYAGLRKDTLCNKDLAKKLLDFPDEKQFNEMSYQIVAEGTSIIKKS